MALGDALLLAGTESTACPATDATAKMTAMSSGSSEPDEQSVADKRRQIDELRQEFRGAQHARSSVGPGPREAPKRLYHYTTLTGLVGIASSHSLWASDVRYLNDASELSYAVELISDVVSTTLSEADAEALHSALPRYPGFANAFEYGRRPFVACFCEEGDLLSQWRGYRAGQTGYSLGLDLSSLTAFRDLPPNTYLRKVVYDEEEQRKEVREVVEAWLQTAETLLNSDRGLRTEDVFPYPAIWALQEALAEHHLCFKHPAFAEEREWRLIKLVDVREELRLLDHQRTEEMLRATAERMKELGVDMPDSHTAWGEADAEGIEIKFRRSPTGLVPYVDLPLSERAGVFTGRLPLWEVIQGPSPNAELARESAAMFLESRGYGFHTELKLSNIPLRD